MNLKRSFLFQAFLFMLMVGLAASTTFISDGVFELHGSAGRNLLQTRNACSVNFEFMNYTIIKSKCKGPKYAPDLCCGAFKEFACPYADAINDSTTDCASTMLTYINLKGNYPPELFASECREGKLGLACPADAPGTSEKADASSSEITGSFFPLTTLVLAFVIGFLFS